MLRYWRGVRGRSQLDLAALAGVSTRHLSFVESGRSQPSRQMLVTLAEALDIPLRERNALFHAAGFANPYPERALDAPELASVLRALRLVLERLEPYPCTVLDRYWNVLLTNEAATHLLAWLLEPAGLAAVQPLNAARLLFSAELRPFLVNWRDIAASFIHRLHREAMTGDDKTRTLVAELLAAPGIPTDWRTPNLERAMSPFVPIVLERDGRRLGFFTTITTLGTPLDVTVQEMRIETYFPTDAATEEALRERR